MSTPFLFSVALLGTLFSYLVITVWSFSHCLRNPRLSKAAKSTWSLVFVFTAPISSIAYAFFASGDKSLKKFSVALVVISILWLLFLPMVIKTYEELAKQQGINLSDPYEATDY